MKEVKSPYHVIKLKEDEVEVLDKLAQYYNLNRTAVVRMLIYKEARALGLLQAQDS